MTQWIRVEDRSPEDRQKVWLYIPDWIAPDSWTIVPAYFDREECKFYDWNGDDVDGQATHWQPMQVPEPPEEE
jgi:hypothetical protein